MHHLTAAGHETTSNTLTWMLYELSKRPAYQARMREEIQATRAQVVSRGDSSFTMDDLDGMKVVLAAIKVPPFLSYRDLNLSLNAVLV